MPSSSIVIAAASIGFDGFYIVGEQEQIFITVFGSIVLTDYTGLYFKISSNPELILQNILLQLYPFSVSSSKDSISLCLLSAARPVSSLFEVRGVYFDKMHPAKLRLTF